MNNKINPIIHSITVSDVMATGINIIIVGYNVTNNNTENTPVRVKLLSSNDSLINANSTHDMNNSASPSIII